MQATTKQIQNVYLVDDDRSLREAVSRLLRSEGFTVRAFRSAVDFMFEYEDDLRGCLLLDVRMPGGPSGLELHRSLVRRKFKLPVIFMTGHGDIPMTVMAMRNGAFDFLVKPVDTDALIEVVKKAMAHEENMWHSETRLRELGHRFETLTKTEQEIWGRVIKGMPNKQIAGDLKCSERTVKAHRASVMTKIGVASLAELVQASTEGGRTGR